jgi:hypothetical protein
LISTAPEHLFRVTVSLFAVQPLPLLIAQGESEACTAKDFLLRRAPRMAPKSIRVLGFGLFNSNWFPHSNFCKAKDKERGA